MLNCGTTPYKFIFANLRIFYYVRRFWLPTMTLKGRNGLTSDSSIAFFPSKMSSNSTFYRTRSVCTEAYIPCCWYLHLFSYYPVVFNNMKIISGTMSLHWLCRASAAAQRRRLLQRWPCRATPCCTLLHWAECMGEEWRGWGGGSGELKSKGSMKLLL